MNVRRVTDHVHMMTTRIARCAFLTFFAARFSSSVFVGVFRCSFFRS
jgi:hypothetical protein